MVSDPTRRPQRPTRKRERRPRKEKGKKVGRISPGPSRNCVHITMNGIGGGGEKRFRRKKKGKGERGK